MAGLRRRTEDLLFLPSYRAKGTPDQTVKRNRGCQAPASLRGVPGAAPSPPVSSSQRRPPSPKACPQPQHSLPRGRDVQPVVSPSSVSLLALLFLHLNGEPSRGRSGASPYCLANQNLPQDQLLPPAPLSAPFLWERSSQSVRPWELRELFQGQGGSEYSNRGPAAGCGRVGACEEGFVRPALVGHP